MNQRGVFITFMVFLLAASILGVYEVTKQSSFRQEEKEIGDAAFNVVNNSFNNLYEEVVSLNKEGFAKQVQQRPMPFQYDFNKNSLILSQRVPVKQATLNAYIDALNVYSLFVNSQWVSKDLNIGTETLKNREWDESFDFPDLNYAILPQCLLFDVNNCCLDVNLMAFKEMQAGQNGCISGFNYSDLNMIDVNIVFDSSNCSAGSIGGNLGSKTDAFDPAETMPYFRITINERKRFCPGAGCIITASGSEARYGHFNPLTFSPAAEIDSLTIDCDGASWLRVKLGKESEEDQFPLAIYNFLKSQSINADLNIVFDQAVDLFYFTGFSINVEKKNFSVKRST
jgi:hypothetical protein